MSSYIKNIIIIQKYIRGYLVRKYVLIPSSYYQTKIWRKNRKWYKTGKNNECEKYQIQILEKIIKLKLNKTNQRINSETYEIKDIRNPLIKLDGYEWSEDFDRKLEAKNKTYYFNLKFVCDNGGAQTRTLKDVYHFIKCQIEHLLKFKTQAIYFINILDGDTSNKNMCKFLYLINKDNNNINKFIFVGSLYDFQKNKYKFF